MNLSVALASNAQTRINQVSWLYWLQPTIAGVLLPLGFAPFHFPGLAILSLIFLITLLNNRPFHDGFLTGFQFGIGYFGFGISWVLVSIHDYGYLNYIISLWVTLCLIAYLSLFTGMVALGYKFLSHRRANFVSSLLFAALWCGGEYLRSNLLGGFPWILVGISQIDTPLRTLLPVLGIYGGSFIACLVAFWFVNSFSSFAFRRYLWLTAAILTLLIPSVLSSKTWSTPQGASISVSVVQANLSMRDKWDEALFFKILNHYGTQILAQLSQSRLIVLPESAIPLPPSYIPDFIEDLKRLAQKNNAAILLGTLDSNEQNVELYRNIMIPLGRGEGSYQKQKLVPFGEYIPKPFQRFTNYLGLPPTGILPGTATQSPLSVLNHTIASLICYELAYPNILRRQLPDASWIVSISDDGWFGHSLAIYQHLQMAQVLSLLSAREQIVANNDGLSALIDQQGYITASLPAFKEGVLTGQIHSMAGRSPWVIVGDNPILILCLSILTIACLSRLALRLKSKSF